MVAVGAASVAAAAAAGLALPAASSVDGAAVAKVVAGRMPGALAQSNVVANMLFGAISGSGAAAAAAMGGTIGPMEKKEGYDPVTVSDGNRAIEALQKADFDLAIVDIHMPYHSGLEVIRFLRTELKKQTPVARFHTTSVG